MNRTLMEKARSMLYESTLEKELWCEAVLCATYATNRSPTRAISGANVGKTPAELWFGEKPNVNNMRMFGSAAYTHIPKTSRTKIDMKSEKNFMVGYAPNGYRLWNQRKKKVVRARDVIFDERQRNSSDEADLEAVESNKPEIKTASVDSGGVGSIIKTGTSGSNIKEVTSKEISSSDEAGTTRQSSSSADAESSTQAKTPEQSSSSDEAGTTRQSNSSADAESSTQLNNEGATQRTGRERKRPDFYGNNIYDQATMALNAESFVNDTPTSFTDIKNKADSSSWMQAVNNEMQSLTKNNTWTLKNLPEGRTAIDCKWVFRRKSDAHGNPGEYKARLVAKGFSQRQGFDYNETYSPVAKLTTFRIILAVANENDWILHQMDVKTAFLNGNLNEEIYMKQPEGFAKGNLVCKLNKSLYGLKQASRMWNERFHTFVTKLGFRRSEYDYCFYIDESKQAKMYILLYVDDLLLVGNDLEQINSTKSRLSTEFEMKDLGELGHFLGMNIERNKSKGTLCINQNSYLRNVLRRFGMENCNGIATPMETGLKLEKTNENVTTSEPYKELIGCLTYVAMTSRPDLCASVNHFSQFQSCATDEHWKHLKRILRYIKSTIDLKLTFPKSHKYDDTVTGYADADWANDINDRKSISGYVFKVYTSLVSWATKKQPTVSLSSTEAEFISLSMASCEAVWISNMVKEMNVNINYPIKLFEDNQSCIYIANNPKEHGRMKHLDVKFNFVRELITNNVIQIIYISTNDQLADVMTKGLCKVKFEKFRGKSNLI